MPVGTRRRGATAPATSPAKTRRGKRKASGEDNIEDEAPAPLDLSQTKTVDSASDSDSEEGSDGSDVEELVTQNSGESDGSSIDDSEENNLSSDDSDSDSDDYLEGTDEESDESQANGRDLSRKQSISGNSEGKQESDIDSQNGEQDELQSEQVMFGPEDSSDEEPAEHKNRVGDIPMEWYKGFEHIGYDIDGHAIAKKDRKDALDLHLQKSDDPKFWRTVYDEKNDEELRISKSELRLIRRMQKGKLAPGADPFPEFPDIFKHEFHELPMNRGNLRKKAFIPSVWENKRIVQMVKAIRNGNYDRKKDEERDPNYDLWSEEAPKRMTSQQIKAPPMPLPGHAESINPPEEFLPSQEEAERWKNLDPQDRERDFLPCKYGQLRRVPAFESLMRQRFERCLDLYLCPRTIKKRIRERPDALLPELPHPDQLRPFPCRLGREYLGHTSAVLCVQCHRQGRLLASGDRAGDLRVWDVMTGRCLFRRSFGSAVSSLAWNPAQGQQFLAVSTENKINFVQVSLCRKGIDGEDALHEMAKQALEAHSSREPSKYSSWSVGKPHEPVVATLTVKHAVKDVSWHSKGDYFVTTSPASNKSAVLVHQFSKFSTQNPFSKNKSDTVCVRFHPTQPVLFVAAARRIQAYHLLKQALLKTLVGGFKFLSSFCVHPTGDHVIATSFDRRVAWFDLDLSSKPYKTVRSDKHGFSSTAVHSSSNVPLFAAAGEDGSVTVFHARVFNDLAENAEIVPVKRLKAHEHLDNEGCFSVNFHPTRPWLFTAGVDGAVRLFIES